PRDELASHHGALVVLADDRRVAFGSAREAEVVRRRANVLAAHDELRPLRTLIPHVAVERKLIATLHFHVAQTCERRDEQRFVLENDVSESEIFAHDDESR